MATNRRTPAAPTASGSKRPKPLSLPAKAQEVRGGGINRIVVTDGKITAK